MRWREHIARFGTAFFPGEQWVRWTFVVLFALAAVLRFWDYSNIPYTHDEISALVRIYPSLSETIQHGVIELDTHPPGVQVLEWAWTNMFGMREWLVKLPFTILALAALFLLFRFAQAWTTSSVALVLTSILATLQYTVMYAQIARPYAIGFFTTALLADQLTRYLANGRSRTMVGIGIAVVLSAYTHHFSLLLAALMVVTGFILIRSDQRKAYLIMCGLAVVLYIPNIPIFIHQLGQGGLSEWLAPPGKYWIMDYAWWVAHCSMPFALILLATIVFAIARSFRVSAPKGPVIWLLALWAATPIVMGLAYSAWRAPVIQYSVLLFSFPYVMILLLMGLGDIQKWVTIGLCALLSCVSTVSLISERHHFELFYYSKYEAIVRGAIHIEEQRSNGDHLILIDAPEEVISFYQKLWNIGPNAMPHVQLRSAPPLRLNDILDTSRAEVVFYGQSNGAPNEQVARIQNSFPELIERKDYAEGQTFLFSRTAEPLLSVIDREEVASAGPNGRYPLSNWEIHRDLPTASDSALKEAWDLSSREYGILFSFDLDTAYHIPQDLFEVIATVRGYADTSDIGLVLELHNADSLIFYRTGELQALLPVQNAQRLVVSGSRSVATTDGPVSLRAYIHNRTKGPLKVERIIVYRRDANPVQYGLMAPITTLGRYR